MSLTLVEKYQLLKDKRMEYCKKYHINPIHITGVSKDLILKGRTSANVLDMNKVNSWKKSDFNLAIATLRYMYSEIFDLSPEKIDALWLDDEDSQFLLSTATRTLVDKIISECSSNIQKDCLFNSKKIVLRLVYPEYYKATYNNKYDVLTDIINADGKTLRDLKVAGKSKTTLIKNKKDNKGTLVDELILEGLEVNFEAREKVFDYSEKLKFLANIKENHLNSLGVIKILKGRGCYASALDFYYLNSPIEKQKEYFSEYVKLRKNSQKEDEITEILNRFKENKYEYSLN